MPEYDDPSEVEERTVQSVGGVDFNRRRILKGAMVGAGLVGFSGVTAADSQSEASNDHCTGMPSGAEGGQEIDDISIEEVTEEVGLLDPLKGIYGHCTAAADVTGNGYLDLFVGSFKSSPVEAYQKRGADGPSPDRLLLGGPEGFTVDESFPEGVPGAQPESKSGTSGATFVDLNNDGNLDMVIARAGLGEHEYNDTVVLKNEDGEFTKATSLFETQNARTPVAFDYNGDGLLDLFIVNDHYYNEIGSRLFRNEGDFEFVDVTEEVGLPTGPGFTGLGATAVDFTGNGYLDLFVTGSTRSTPSTDEPVTSDRQVNRMARLFVNNGGSFHEVQVPEFEMPTAIWTDESAGFAVADLNRNGRLDLVIGTHYHSELASESTQKLFVYLNRGLDDEGAPEFEEVTDAAGIPDLPLNDKTTRVPHVELVDFDNNGWPDIHTSLSKGDGTEPAIFRHTGVDENGVPQFETPSGLGDERTAPPTESIWDVAGYNRYWANGVAADYNRDGQMDAMLTEWFPDLPSRMFYNKGDVGNWLFVDVAPQPVGVGALIEVFCPGRLGDADARIGTRPVVKNTGYAAGTPSEVHFGLGQAPAVDLRVTFPNGGGVVERRGVRANQRLTIEANESG